MAAIKKEPASDDFVLSTTDSVTTSGIKTENFDQQDGVVKMEDVPTQKKTDEPPVVHLNKLIPGLKYDLVSDVTQEEGKLFTMSVNIKGVIFEGTGNSKKAARMATAQTALLQLFNTVYCPVISGSTTVHPLHTDMPNSEEYVKRRESMLTTTTGENIGTNGKNIDDIMNKSLTKIIKVDQADRYTETFIVSSDLVGRAIGSHGSNIRKARNIPGVSSVKTVDCDDGGYRFYVRGETKEAVKKARSILEFCKETFNVPSQFADFEKQTTNQHQGYNQQPNVPPQPYDPGMMPQQPYCQANPGMMLPVQQYMYVPVPVPQSGQPQMPAQYPGQPLMAVPYGMGQPQMPTQNPGLPMSAPYPPPLMSQPTFPPNFRQSQLNTSQRNLNILEQTTEKGKSGKKSRRKADNQNSSDGLLENPDKSKPSDQHRQKPNKGQESRQSKREDDGFDKLKSLLSEEPSEEARYSKDSEFKGEEGDGDRGQGCKKKRRGGRGRQRGRYSNRQDSDNEEQNSSNDDQEKESKKFDSQQLNKSRRGHLSGSKSHDLNEDVCSDSIEGRGRGRGRGKGRGRGDNHDRIMKQDRNDAENDTEDETIRQNNRGQWHQRGRGRNGGRGRGGHKEQVDRNVHQSEDDKSRHDNESNRGRGRYRGRGRGDRHQHDIKCHQRDQDDETEIADVDDNEVFKFMIKKFGGGCYFEDFMKKCDLFPLNANIPRWFTKHSRRFHIYRDGQKIVYLSPFYRDARICTQYNNKRTKCDKTHCDYFHVCRHFVRGNCRQSDCSLSHSFKSADNRSLKEKLGISDFSDVDIKIVLNSNSPSVCYDYIHNKGCKVPDSQRRCPYLHLCRLFIFKKCTEHCKFKLTHSIQQFHNKWVLTSCHMKDWPIGRVLKSIYVPPRTRTETGDYSDNSDLSQDEEDSSVCGYDSDTYKYSDFIETESTESLSGHTDDDHSKRFNKLIHSMKKLDTEDKGDTEPSIGRVKLSRMGRFKSTEDIISGIVGKDDQGLVKISVAEDLGAIPKQRQRTGSYHDDDDDDDMDIKEKERLLMEEWEQEHGSSSTLDASERKSRQMKKSQCDSDYQERCHTLLLDEAENTNICIHVTEDKCPAKTCKNHHLKTGIPYLWQIKMPGRWCSFSTAENEKIEKGFTDLLDVVSLQMVCDHKQYSYYVYFTNPMYAVVYDDDGRADDQDYKYVVRRLSTPSFTEKNMSTDCYRTQWRWYFKDDTQKWVSYSKDVFQFTLEKKYITKQKTYLFTRDNFNFKYRIDFLNMTQTTNLDTLKVCQVVRRPLFVSKVDIEQKKYPEIIPFPAASSTTKPMHFYHWDCAHDFELVELDSTGKEYNDVMKSLSDSMDPGRFNVKDIYRIQNRKLWSEYDTKKKHMLADAEQDGRGQNVDERDLFHGTDSLNTCHGICTNNFDFRTSGRNATLYGEGSYFAVRSKLSHSYTKADTPFEYRFMLRARVLVGQFAEGNPSLRRPPEIQGQSHKLYDSCVDKVPDPQIFVIFDRNQCYPEYLFMYTDRDTVPVVPVQQQIVYSHPATHTIQSSVHSARTQLSKEHRQKGDKCVIQ